MIGQARGSDPLLFPDRDLVRRALYLRSHNAAPANPLAAVFTPEREYPVSVTPRIIAPALRCAVLCVHLSLGFLPGDVSARCLCVASANALICTGVDTDITRLLGRWRSD